MLDKVKELLSRDLFAHVSHLKMIEEYADCMEIKLFEQENSWGIVMLIPVSASSFDTEIYPEAEFIVYLAASDNQTIPQLLKEIPRDKDLVFKIHKPVFKDAIEKEFPLTWKRAYLSYSCRHIDDSEELSVVVKSTRLDEQLLPLWTENGYSRNDIEKYFANGACSFTIYMDGKPVSTCLIFHNCFNIWEVGAVHTVESKRRKGYAGKVVKAAVSEILKSGNVPKYQVVHSNIPSIKLAESLGMELILKLEHYYYKADILPITIET